MAAEDSKRSGAEAAGEEQAAGDAPHPTESGALEGAPAHAERSEPPADEDAPDPGADSEAPGDESASEGPPRKKKKKKKKKKPVEPPPEEDEEEVDDQASVAPARRARMVGPIDEDALDAPNRQALLLLGVLFAVVLVLWVAARGFLNARGLEAKQPRSVTTAELSRDPKSAALELQLRSSGYDPAGAMELAAGPLLEQLEAEKKDCEADGAACEKRRAELAGRPLATAVLLAREPAAAWVRLELREGLGAPGRRIAKVERREGAWKVVERRDDDGSWRPPPGALTEPVRAPLPAEVQPWPVAPPPSSAAPATSAAPGVSAAPAASAAPAGSARNPLEHRK